MRLQNWGLVAVAAIAIAGTASAQDPTYGRERGFAMSGPTVAAASHKFTGHSANVLREAVSQGTGNYWWSNCPNGQRCNSGAGSFSADLGFAFGPSKSFFAPCGPRVLPDCNGAGCHKCRTPIYGRGPVGPWPGCTYDSYLNH